MPLRLTPRPIQRSNPAKNAEPAHNSRARPAMRAQPARFLRERVCRRAAGVRFGHKRAELAACSDRSHGTSFRFGSNFEDVATSHPQSIAFLLRPVERLA